MHAPLEIAHQIEDLRLHGKVPLYLLDEQEGKQRAPSSVYETDEEIRWDESGDPAKADNDDLLMRARLLASICLLARYWPGSGVRHDAALSLGGFLARAGLPTPQIKYLVEAIARTAGDAEHQDRKATAEDAAHVNGGRNPGHCVGAKAGQFELGGGRSRSALFDSAVASERPVGFGRVVEAQTIPGSTAGA